MTDMPDMQTGILLSPDFYKIAKMYRKKFYNALHCPSFKADLNLDPMRINFKVIN